MTTEAKKGVQHDPVPAGSHVARCIKFIHFGNILEQNFHGEMTYQNKMRYTWELPNETRVFDEEQGEQPMSISKDYTLSLGDKANLRKDLESWRGKAFTPVELDGFDVEKVVGAPCLINVIHKTSKTGNQYAVIAGISPLPKGMECPAQVNKTFIWNYNDHFDAAVLEEMHEWFRDKIKSSMEYKAVFDPVDPDDSFPTQEDEFEPTNDLPF